MQHKNDILRVLGGSMHKMTILIVDDDIFFQELFKSRLQSFDVHILILENGLQAVELVKQGPVIDLIFMDVNMPVMDGYEAIQIIRKHEKDSMLKEVPIILVGGSIEEDNQNLCITKPVSQEKLNDILHKYLFKENIIDYDIKKVAQSLNISQELIKNLIQKLLLNLDGELDSMKEMNEKDDYVGLYALGHKLKGRFASLQLQELADISSAIEIAAKNKENIDYKTLIQKMREHAKKLEKL